MALAQLREIAEYPNSFGPLGPGDERIETNRYTICLGPSPTSSTVQRQRFRPDEIDEVLGEVRALLRARNRKHTQWEIGSQAQPPNLVELLLDRGIVRDHEPYAVALVLTQAPPEVADIIARRIETFGEFTAASEVQRRAFKMPDREIEEARPALPQDWRDTPTLMHGVWLNGELVGAGVCAPTEHGLLLYGGATLPHARGRGVYRALISARWREAVARGTPALLTQAGAMSRPILERMGFEPVGHVHMLIDDF